MGFALEFALVSIYMYPNVILWGLTIIVPIFLTGFINFINFILSLDFVSIKTNIINFISNLNFGSIKNLWSNFVYRIRSVNAFVFIKNNTIKAFEVIKDIFSNPPFIRFRTHRYHLVDMSPHPYLVSLSTFILLFRFVC